MWASRFVLLAAGGPRSFVGLKLHSGCCEFLARGRGCGFERLADRLWPVKRYSAILPTVWTAIHIRARGCERWRMPSKVVVVPRFHVCVLP